MYGLTATLSTASQTLNADSGAIAVTNDNIANVNTPGYSRELVNLSPDALSTGGALQGNGVSLGSFSSVRDSVLQLAINQKTSDLASSSSQSTTWTQIQSSFSGTDSGLGAAISTFFNGLSALSTSPTDPATRQTAFGDASQLVDAFHQSASSLSDALSGTDQNVADNVQQVNNLTSQIAGLDQQISQMGPGQDGGSLEDQRDELTRQLAQVAGLSIVTTESTPTLALSNGTPLVIGGTAYPLGTAQSVSGATQILDGQGNNITAGITGGALGGSVAMRDQIIPGLQQSLNQLASQFATALNTAQAQGYDLSGNGGAAMFTLPQGGSDAAATIALSLTTPSAIAASSDGSSGSSGNLANLLGVQSSSLPSGMTPTNAYAQLVQSIGTASAANTSQVTATTASLNQLVTQQSSESGVSIDEETTNLLRYQQAYSAAAQVISTLNSLFSTVLNMAQ